MSNEVLDVRKQGLDEALKQVLKRTIITKE